MIFIVLLLNAFIVYFAKSSASLAAAFTLLALAPELSYRSHITHITTTLPYLDSQLEHRTSQPQQPTANTKTKHTNYSIFKQTYTLVPLKYIRMIASHSRPRSRDPISIFVYLVFAHWHSTHFAFTNHFFLSFYVFLLSSAFSSLFWCYYCSYCFGLPTFVFFCVWCFYFFSAGFRLFDAYSWLTSIFRMEVLFLFIVTVKTTCIRFVVLLHTFSSTSSFTLILIEIFFTLQSFVRLSIRSVACSILAR